MKQAPISAIIVQPGGQVGIWNGAEWSRDLMIVVTQCPHKHKFRVTDSSIKGL